MLKVWVTCLYIQNQVNLITFKINTTILCVNKTLNESEIQDVRQICGKYNTGDHKGSVSWFSTQ